MRPAKQKNIACLVAFAAIFYLATVQGTAVASIIEIDENLDDNLLPADFSLSVTNNAGLANGRLEANAIDGSAALVYHGLPTGLNQVDIRYRGRFGYSFWGTYTEVSIGGLPITMSHGVNDFKFGSNDYASLSGADTVINSLSRTSFDYHITLVDGQVSYSAIDSMTNLEAFNLVYSDAGILLAAINQISLRAHNTTGRDAVWLDDIEIDMQVSAVPLPGAVWLFGTALAGLIGFGRRGKTA